MKKNFKVGFALVTILACVCFVGGVFCPTLLQGSINGHLPRESFGAEEPTPKTPAFAHGNCDDHNNNPNDWTAIDTSTTSIGAGKYYLNADVELGENSLTVSSGTVELCLNGQILSRSGTGAVISVGSGATLNIYDNSGATRSWRKNEDGNVVFGTAGTSGSDGNTLTGGIITGGAGTNGGGIYVQGTLNFFGGNVAGNKAASGGGIYNDGGTVTIDGGNVAVNSATSGGGVYVSAGSAFNFAGGTISNNSAFGNGGGVFLDGNFSNGNYNVGSFRMSGGEISGNTGTENGGGVFAKSPFNSETSAGGFILFDGKISGNSGKNGGGVYASEYFEMRSGVTLPSGSLSTGGEITGNTATESGGSVLVAKTFKMNGGEISGNTGTENGGGVSIESTGTFGMMSGKISGNTSGNGGGVYVLGEFNFDGGEISANLATTQGGGVFAGGTLNVLGSGKISGNLISGNPSNLFLASDKKINVAGNLFEVVGGAKVFADISVTLENSGDSHFTNGYFVAGTTNSENVEGVEKVILPSLIFKCDKAGFDVTLTEGNEVFFKAQSSGGGSTGGGGTTGGGSSGGGGGVSAETKFWNSVLTQINGDSDSVTISSKYAAVPLKVLSAMKGAGRSFTLNIQGKEIVFSQEILEKLEFDKATYSFDELKEMVDKQAPAPTPTPEPEPTEPPAPEPESKNSPVWLWILLGATGCFLIVFAVVILNKKRKK